MIARAIHSNALRPLSEICVMCLLLSSVVSAQVVITGGKTTGAASTTSSATLNIPSGAAPTTPADGDVWYDSTQGAEAFQQATSSSIFRGGVVSGCVNVSPITVSSNTTMAQNLLSCTLPANLLNTVGKTLKVWLAGFYTTNAAGGTFTISVTLGGSDICKRTEGVNFVNGITNNPWNMTCYITTQTAGSMAKFEAQGNLILNTNASQTNASNVYPILNTATVPAGTLDTTNNLTLQVTATFSTNQASANTAQQRQLLVEVEN
jgi:hypothetical protein